MFDYSHLKYPPIKPPKRPPFYIFRIKGWEKENIQVYGAFSSKDGQMYGQVACSPCRILHNGKFENSLYIEDLISQKPNSGAGSYLMKYMKILSKKLGCDGRIHLMASSCLQPERVPHPFYYRLGMSTGNEKLDRKIAQFAKSGKSATSQDFQSVMMYYPPAKTQKPKGFLEYIARYARYMTQEALSNTININL